MAAADYFHAGPLPAQRPPNPTYLAPLPQPQRTSSHPNYVYPPYQQSSSTQASPQLFPRPSYQSTPSVNVPNSPYAQTPPQRNSFSYSQRPDPQTWNPTYLAPPNPNQPTQYQPQQFAPPPRPGHRPSYSQPYLHPNHSSASLTSGYSSESEFQRPRRHSDHKKSRSSTRSTNTDGFIGAASGGLIGDLIFPGLGAVGGALAGWIGGQEYSEHKKRRDSQLEIKQREWEEKFDPDGRRRSAERRKHSHDSGRH